MLAWAEYMSGKSRWANYINSSNDNAGLLMMIRANNRYFGEYKDEAILQSNELVADYLRLKKNGTKINALDARSSLISLAAHCPDQ